MSSGIEDLFMHEVTVETFTGSGAYGDTWADESDPVACYLDEKRQLVRDDTGDEVVSEASLFVTLTDGDLFPPGSRVHVPGRVALVISRARRDGRLLDLPSHTELALT